MGHVNRYYFSKVLEELCGMLSEVSGHVYSENRPSTSPEQMDDLVVVSIPATIDRGAWQAGTVRFELVARNRANGAAPTARLGEMLDRLAELFPIVRKRFSASRPQVVLKGTDGTGFTIWNVQADLLINTTDSYEY